MWGTERLHGMTVTPRMNVNEVISIGRNRAFDAATVASTMLRPSPRPSLAFSTMRMAFLADSAMSNTNPIWT